MLEFMGFIALIAIVFGVSFSAALAGFLKVIAICAGVIVAVGIIFKLIESRKGSIFVIFASLAAIAVGISLVNDDYNRRINRCNDYTYLSSNVLCMNNAMEDHNSAVNTGWGYIVCGTIVGFIGVASLEDTNAAKQKDVKTRLAA